MPDSGPSSQPGQKSIYVVSDGRGQTCSKVLQAALVQFEGHHVEIAHEAEVRTPRCAVMRV